jgi:hypothetical protein
MTYHSESQIDGAINQLEYQRTHRNFSLPEEQKIIREIDKLRRSKNELRYFLHGIFVLEFFCIHWLLSTCRIYNRVVSDRKGMNESLKGLRDSRQVCAS